jgi:predicted NAD/FAD-dependent oxidoreductase
MNNETTDYLVIGAGLAGLAFAEDASARGATVRLLDKGRGVGGRAATRRLGDDLRADHGAQYFTARGDRFKRMVQAGIKDGWLAIWSHGFPLWKSGEIIPRPEGHPRYAPPAGMSALPKHLAQGRDIALSATVTGVSRGAVSSDWTAHCSDGRAFTGRKLILNLPPTQLLSVAGEHLPERARLGLQTVVFDPAWTLIAALEEDISNADWPAVEFEQHPVLALASRDHTKRGSVEAPPVLVAHGNGAWSREHLEEEPTAVQQALLEAVEKEVGPLKVRSSQVHRWRYAQPTTFFPGAFFWDGELGIGGCGDWCGKETPVHGSKVEAALESGWMLAAEAIPR